MIKLCQDESRRRCIKEVTLCCDDVKELGQYDCEKLSKLQTQEKKNYQNNFQEKPA